MRSLAIFALATILTLLPVSADPETQERPTEPGDATLVLRFATEPPTLNPITYRDVYGGIILEYTSGYLYVEDKDYLRNVASGKMKPRPEGPLKPELAAGYPEIW